MDTPLNPYLHAVDFPGSTSMKAVCKTDKPRSDDASRMMIDYKKGGSLNLFESEEKLRRLRSHLASGTS